MMTSVPALVGSTSGYDDIVELAFFIYRPFLISVFNLCN
jgi:hypothetical protein